MLLIAAPPVGVIAGWACLLAMAAGGSHPVWPLQPRNLAEAAAFEDGAAVVRRAEAGEDVNGPGEVRAGALLPEPATMTPIEAAALTGQVEMMQLLFDLGAMPDAASWQHAFCTADEPSRELLATRRPPGAHDECAPR